MHTVPKLFAGTRYSLLDSPRSYRSAQVSWYLVYNVQLYRVLGGAPRKQIYGANERSRAASGDHGHKSRVVAARSFRVDSTL